MYTSKSTFSISQQKPLPKRYGEIPFENLRNLSMSIVVFEGLYENMIPIAYQLICIYTGCHAGLCANLTLRRSWAALESDINKLIGPHFGLSLSIVIYTWFWKIYKVLALLKLSLMNSIVSWQEDDGGREFFYW